MLPPEQINQIKEQLFTQIENLPPEKREETKKQIQAMNAEQLEQFLIQNNLIKSDQNQTPQEQKCIFCSIIFGEIPTNKIDENKHAIATLEINPISKGHTLVIPKEHIPSTDKFPKSIFTLAKKISKKLKSKFNAKDVIISSTNLFGHEILNVVPVYTDETINSKRYQEKPEELQKLEKLLAKKSRAKSKTIKKPRVKKINPEKLWLPKRIP